MTSGYTHHANQRSETPTYRIGQNRIITSTLQQPRMAEISSLSSMEIGAANVLGAFNGYTEQEPLLNQQRRVGPGGHIPDPFLTPVGDIPCLPTLLFVAIYLLSRLRSHSRSVR